MYRKAVKIKRGRGSQYKLFAVNEKDNFVFGIVFDDDINSKQISSFKLAFEKAIEILAENSECTTK